jgi:UDP-N-acetylglucosamine:LPS N-acetylglucosamine transferase
MKVCFICRGYPGLGKVVGSVAIDEILKNFCGKENYQSLFLTYYVGYKFLKSIHYPVIDILNNSLHICQSGFCTPFGLETKKLVETITEFKPDLVFNDGEPYLLEITSELLKLPTVVLAHPADLHSPANSKLAIDLFRHFYSKAALVLAHGLDRLPSASTWIGGKASQVIEMNTIVRDSIYQETLKPKKVLSRDSPYIVGVLGGGSKNVASSFWEGTIKFGEWMITACNKLNIKNATLYCADENIYTKLQNIPTAKTSLSLVAQPKDNSHDIIQADIVIGRAGRNLLSELIALGKKGIIVPVYAEKFRGGNQIRTAQRALELNPNFNISLLDDGYDSFQESLERLIEEPLREIQWQPGNARILQVIKQHFAYLMH